MFIYSIQLLNLHRFVRFHSCCLMIRTYDTPIYMSVAFRIVISMISHRTKWYNEWWTGVVWVYARAYQTFYILLHQTISYFISLSLWFHLSFLTFCFYHVFSSFHHSIGFILEIRNQYYFNSRFSWTCSNVPCIFVPYVRLFFFSLATSWLNKLTH